MLCMALSGGQLVVVDPPPIHPDPTTCPYVVRSFSTTNADLFLLSPAEGAQIAVAILLVWGIAFAIRVVVQSLSIGDENGERS